MPPAARVSDNHVCRLGGGPILAPCQPTVLIGNLAAARVTDSVSDLAGTDSILQGSQTVIIGNLQSARVGDPTVAGGAIAMGDETVWIGPG